MLAPFPEKITRKALLALPARKWDAQSEYDHILLTPTGKKHDSGYGLIAIIGVVHGEPNTAERAALCDDICWTFPLHHPYDRNGKHNNILRTDMYFPSGIIRMWASSEHYFRGTFRVGCSLSSTEVELALVPIGDEKNTERLFNEAAV